jgi:hypothetical protein
VTDAEWEALWTWGATVAETDAAVRKEAEAALEAERRARIAAWRQRHPEATCRDVVAAELAWLEEAFGRQRTAA